MDTTIRPIKNEEDYARALEAIETIFDADEGTPEADQRDVLAVLIEKYEDEHYQIDLPDPIEAMKFRMEQEGLTQKDLSPLLGNRSKVSEVLSGKRALSLKMMRAVHKHLGIPAEVLLKEASIESFDDGQDIDFEKLPITEMAKYGAFGNVPKNRLQDSAEELIRSLLQRLGAGFSLSDVKFRKTTSVRLNSNLNTYALQAWMLHLLSAASKRTVSRKYERESLNDKFIDSLVALSIMDEGPKLAQELLHKYGIILEVVHHYKNTYLDGAAYITDDGQPIVGLTLRYDRIDNFWFTLLHEIAHIKFHLEPGNYIADDMSLRGAHSDDRHEREADEFAERALLPHGFDLDQKEIISREDVHHYAHTNNVHPAIVAGRIQHTKNNYRLFSNMVGRGEVRKWFEN